MNALCLGIKKLTDDASEGKAMIMERAWIDLIAYKQ
jgi:hypothetical protein